MPLVDVTIAGRRHSVQCGDGEEPRLRRLAAYVDAKAGELARSNPQLGEARLLMLTGLTVADELVDAYDELRRVRQELDRQGAERDAEGLAAVARVAERLERLADALAKP